MTHNQRTFANSHTRTLDLIEPQDETRYMVKLGLRLGQGGSVTLFEPTEELAVQYLKDRGYVETTDDRINAQRWAFLLASLDLTAPEHAAMNLAIASLGVMRSRDPEGFTAAVDTARAACA